MALWGLDVQQVRTLSTQLNQKAEEIEGILSTLTNTLGSTQWEGPDATAFRNEWSSTHTAALRQVINALRDASSKAQQNAAAQEKRLQQPERLISVTGGELRSPPNADLEEIPMSGMYGADVAQLRAAANQFARMAEQLDVSRMTVAMPSRSAPGWVRSPRRSAINGTRFTASRFTARQLFSRTAPTA